MRDVVKILLRVQKWEIIKEENRILYPNDYVKLNGILDGNIAKALASLPEKHQARYKKLRENGMAVAQESGGVCQFCKMVISPSVLNRMRNEETEWICPNCGRFLFLNVTNNK